MCIYYLSFPNVSTLFSNLVKKNIHTSTHDLKESCYEIKFVLPRTQLDILQEWSFRIRNDTSYLKVKSNLLKLQHFHRFKWSVDCFQSFTNRLPRKESMLLLSCHQVGYVVSNIVGPCKFYLENFVIYEFSPSQCLDASSWISKPYMHSPVWDCFLIFEAKSVESDQISQFIICIILIRPYLRKTIHKHWCFQIMYSKWHY